MLKMGYFLSLAKLTSNVFPLKYLLHSVHYLPKGLVFGESVTVLYVRFPSGIYFFRPRTSTLWAEKW